MSGLYPRIVQFGLRAYKLTLSPLIGRQCRFIPSCSEYMAEALVVHGPWRGSVLGLRRICRCRPFVSWGYDPVPPLRPSAHGAKDSGKCDE
jgi:putative membrane protein insertion efficiency factor